MVRNKYSRCIFTLVKLTGIVKPDWCLRYVIYSYYISLSVIVTHTHVSECIYLRDVLSFRGRTPGVAKRREFL